MPLDIEREIGYIRSIPGFNWIANAFDKVMQHVNQLGANLGGDTVPIGPPPAVQGINVKSSGTGLVHVVLSDNAPIQRNIHYFVEYDTSSGFTRPHVIHLGTSREVVMRLPGLTDGSAPQSFYFRGYSQYPGSSGPSNPIAFNGAVNPGGTDTLTMIPSNGSGTGSNGGMDGGSGFGRVLKRRL